LFFFVNQSFHGFDPETLSTTVDYLLTGEETKKTPLHNVKLLERFRALEGFQPDDQETVIS